MPSDLIDIEKELVRHSNALSDLVEEFEGLCVNAAQHRTDYDIEWAKSLLRFNDPKLGKITQGIKEAMATEACQDVMTRARISEAIRDAARERLRSLQTLISVHQSRLRWLDEGARLGK